VPGIRKRLGFLTAILAIAVLFLIACKEEENGAKSDDVNQTQGVTDTEIRIGTLLPLSGNPAAAWGIALSKGMQAYFDYINDQGGIYGRKLRLFVGDNQYSGPVASEAVRKLVEQDNIFLIQGSLGTEAHTAVYKYLEERGIPDLYILTGNAKWTEPVARNRFTALMDYTTEGRTFARYLYQNYDGKKLGILAQNDDYGKEGESGIRDELKALNADIDVSVEYYDAAQSDVTSQVQRLKNANVDIIIFWGQPIQAANMIKTVRQTLSWDAPMILNSTNAQDIMATLAGLDNIEGTVSAVIGGQAYQTEYPEIQEVKEIMAKYAPDVPFDNTSLAGYVISAGIAAFIKQAGPNLTRNGLLDAMESLCKYTCDTCLVPASTSPTDHRLVEAEILARATVDRSTDPPTFRWQPFGEPFDFESTKECTRPTPPPEATYQPGPSIPIQ
jgi:ABC-type branched-subunit amino acid transport system substrate-binding protein